ncbi:MAG: hypothetical protein U0Y96_10225 [Candidatus Kapaibacterium sp.]
MKKQTIIWTVLPNGINGTNLKLTLYMAPQLVSDTAFPPGGKLSEFKDWRNWANKMASATFKIGFRNPASAAPDVILDATKTSASPEMKYWSALFTDNTYVRPFELKNYPDRLVRSYPIRNILTHIKKTYQDVAIDHPEDKPKGSDLSIKLKEYCFYDIPKRTKPANPLNPAVGSLSHSTTQQQQPDTRTYKRRPLNDDEKIKYYSSILDSVAQFVPTELLNKRDPNNKNNLRTKFQRTIKNDLLFLQQDPNSKLCTTTLSGLSSLYSELAEHQANRQTQPDKTKDFLQLSLYYKPRNAVNENYLTSRYLRHNKKTGKPFYYDAVNNKYSTDRRIKEVDDTTSPPTTVVEQKDYDLANDLMYQGEISPYSIVKLNPPKYDFHDIVNTVNKYPWLLRKLGIAIDIEVPLATVPVATLGSPCYVYVIPNWSSEVEPIVKTNQYPRTAYYLDGTMFVAAPKTIAQGDMLHGMLTVGNNKLYDVVTVEPGGSGIKFLHTINTLNRFQNRFLPLFIPKSYDLNTLDPENVENDSNESLPNLRNNGIAVSKLGHAYTMVQRIKSVYSIAQKAIVNPVDPANVMYLEDITRGFRADVMDEATPGKWFSLHERVGRYTFLRDGTLNTTISSSDDEGFISPSTSSSSDNSTEDLYTTEMLVEWSGWSLAAPRPMKTVEPDEFKEDPSGTIVDGGKKYSVDIRDPYSTPPSSDGTNVSAIFLSKPSSLPRLRYGHSYSVRMRTVDLSGNSWKIAGVPDDTKIPNSVSKNNKYNRYDVVKNPVLLLRDPITKSIGSGKFEPLSHAESLEQMVIRSNRGKTTEQYTTDHPHFKVDSERFVTAPKVDYTFAETHGVFDKKYFDSGATDKAEKLFNLITSKDYNFSNYPTSGIFTQDPMTKDPIVIGSFELPYLPDPLAKGIVLRRVPGTRAEKTGGSITKHAKLCICRGDGSAMQIKEDVADIYPDGLMIIEYKNAHTPSDWLNAYPDNCLIRIKLIELKSGADPTPEWDASSRVLILKVAQSDRFRVKYSSYLNGKDASKYFALYNWVDEMPSSANRDKTLKHMETGVHWMLTPYRNLMLVHAVQQPLEDPQFYKTQFKRNFGETTVSIKDEGFPVHGKSTVKVDIVAQWKDQIDNLNLDAPQDGQEIPVGEGETAPTPVKPLAFSAQVGEHVIDDRFAKQIYLSLVQDFKDTKHHYVNYTPVGTSRFREYFPAQDSDTADKDKDGKKYLFTANGKVLDKHIVSTARPDALKVLYSVPVFAWKESNSADSTDHLRLAGLRVYMERPWYSSGNDEKLGVVLVTPGTNAEVIMSVVPKAHPISKLVTMWGYDPIWLSKPTPSELFPSSTFFMSKSKDLPDSPMVDGVIKNVRFQELDSNPTVQNAYKADVVLHDVFFDPERKLWYSDIMITHGESYFPFIRLALCRIQPYSLSSTDKDVYMSKVTQHDFMQIMPLRKTSASTVSGTQVKVTVEGVSYRSSVVGVIGSEIEVSLEEQTPNIGQEFGWTEVSVTPFDRVNANILGGFWGGIINLPKDKSSTKYRLVIKEYEQFHADLDSTGSVEFKAYVTGGTKTKVTRRIVFADTINLF